jgi:DNA-binding transcriptional LysR family regulator
MLSHWSPIPLMFAGHALGLDPVVEPAGVGVFSSGTYPPRRPRLLLLVTADLDLARLRIFREVAVRGSFTAAATALRLTQPAVSQQIAKLEKEMGAVLLDRSARSVAVTPPGRALLGHVDAVLARLDDARREVAALAHPDGGELALAAFPSASVTVVAALVAAWSAASREGCVRVSEADPPAALPGVIRGDFDLALAYDYALLRGPQDPRLHVTEVAHDPMAVALPTDHPLAGRNTVPLAALAGLAWVAPHDCGCHDALVLACGKAGFRPRIVTHTNDYLTMLGLVRAGVGVAVVPRLIAAGAGTVQEGVVLRPLARSPLVRTISVVGRTAGYGTPAVERMVRTVRTLVPALAHPDLPLAPAA